MRFVDGESAQSVKSAALLNYYFLLTIDYCLPIRLRSGQALWFFPFGGAQDGPGSGFWRKRYLDLPLLAVYTD